MVDLPRTTGGPKNGKYIIMLIKIFEGKFTPIMMCSGVARGGPGDPRLLGLRPKIPGAASPQERCCGLRPQTSAGAQPQTPLGAPAPRKPPERGLARSPNGVRGGAPAGVWRPSPQQRSCGEAAPGCGEEPQLPRSPGPFLATALIVNVKHVDDVPLRSVHRNRFHL